jgi:hypothetical protein
MQQLLGLGSDPTAADEPTERSAPQDAATLFAREAVAAWAEDLHDLAGNAALCDYLRVPEAVMAELVQEIIAGARRLDLEQRITAKVREVTSFRMRFQQIVALPARLGGDLINRYVDFLGYDALDPGERPALELEDGPRPIFRPRPTPRNGPKLGERQSRYDQEYYTDWIRGFMDLVQHNARFQGGGSVDIAANQHIGALLERLGAAI